MVLVDDVVSVVFIEEDPAVLIGVEEPDDGGDDNLETEFCSTLELFLLLVVEVVPPLPVFELNGTNVYGSLFWSRQNFSTFNNKFIKEIIEIFNLKKQNKLTNCLA